MDTNAKLYQDMTKILVKREDIQKAVAQLGREITHDYQGRDLVMVCILKGASVFFSDLIREVDLPVTLDFMALSSYRNSTKSSGVVNLEKDLSLESIARQFYMSKSYLMHKFKEMTGYSAHKYIQQKRLIQAAELIRDGVPVVEAGQRCGYGDYSAFLRAFKKLYGVNPSDIS